MKRLPCSRVVMRTMMEILGYESDDQAAMRFVKLARCF